MFNSYLPVNRAASANKQGSYNLGRFGWWVATPSTRNGTVLRDVWGGNNGTFGTGGNGTVAWSRQSRPSGSASLYFNNGASNAQGAYASLVPSASWPSSYNYTLSAWISMGVTTASYPAILSPQTYGNGPNGFGFLVFQSTATVYASVTSGSTDFGPQIAAINTGWHHIALTINGGAGVSGAAVAKTYIDGVPAYSTTGTFGLLTIATPFVAGQRYGGGVWSNWPGYIDDIGLWTRDLSPSEIAAMYGDSRINYPIGMNHVRPWFVPGSPTSTFSFAATLAAQSLASSLTSSAPASSSQAFSATLAAQSLAASVGTSNPPSSSFQFAPALAAQTFTASLTTASPSSSSMTFAAALAAQSLAASLTAASPASMSLAFAATTGAQSFTSSITAAAPGASSFAFAGTVGAQSLATVFSTTAILPVDLLDAIGARFIASALNSTITGGLFNGDASRKAAFPYATVEEVSASLVSSTSSSKVHSTRLAFRVYADDMAVAGPAGDALEVAYQGQYLRFVRGYTSAMVRGNRRHYKDMKRSVAARDVWCLQVEFETKVIRT